MILGVSYGNRNALTLIGCKAQSVQEASTMRNTLSALTLSALAALLLATPVAATPLETGCPSGYAAKTVVEWEAMGDYRVPRRVDEAGNQDGIVCGRALPDGFLFGWAITANGLNPTVDVLYLFSDNNNPARR